MSADKPQVVTLGEALEKALAALDLANARLLTHHQWSGAVVDAEGSCNGCRVVGAVSTPQALQQPTSEGVTHDMPMGIAYAMALNGRLLCKTTGLQWMDCSCDNPTMDRSD